jgi:peptide chain release factor 3
MSEDTQLLARIQKERLRRRTFAIISHPDAGKTTLTEKLLLFGGAIRQAGSVRARKAARHATSDWMKIEQERGISITSSVLQFEYKDRAINLLDTPGHQDFSEDTYRTLSAADAAVMLIDGAKGVEAQTIKLFKVCAMRKIPIFTFVNKLDRASQSPLDLMDEIEKVLGLAVVPLTWPVGSGQLFRGIYSRETSDFFVFDRENTVESATEMHAMTLDDAIANGHLSQAERDELEEDCLLLDEAQENFELDKVLAGEITPMFFGSAMNNFGVEHFLSRFLAMAPKPVARSTSKGILDPESPEFSAFVFKIQANMDPAHRDRLAFMRICSGEFSKDTPVMHTRMKKKIKLTNPQQMMAKDRTAVELAYPGDIIGVFDPGHFRIGDTVCEKGKIQFEGIPRFAPEIFSIVRLVEIGKRKQLKKGLEQLSQEGAIQIFRQRGMLDKDPIVGAVGALQFEVLKARLEMEYNVKIDLTSMPYKVIRQVQGSDEALKKLQRGELALLVEDRDSLPMLLIRDEWSETHLKDTHKEVTFSKPPGT